MSKSAGRNGRGAPVTRVPQKPLSEAAKIEFTKTLHELRNGTLEEFTFPTTLTNIERQFLHKMSDELGLKHKSHGKGESRCMTVKKYVGEIVAVGAPPQVSWEPCQAVEGLLCDRSFTSVNIRHLQQHPGRAKHQITAGSGGRHSNSNSKSNNPTTSNNSNNGAYAILQDKRKAHRDFNAMQTNRSKLPAFEFREVIPQIVNSRQMLLISGETGCGKSTQVPQFLFDNELIGPHCKIAITQPRRISAVSVAERVAHERGEQLGETVGFSIRLESVATDTTQIMFMTPGVLLRKLMTDPLLDEFTHIVVDEAHERDRFTEFLLIVLRDVCRARPSLKLILMSATMHTDKLVGYFGDIEQISIGGSMYPVTEHYLEHVLQAISSPGSGFMGGAAADTAATDGEMNSRYTSAGSSANTQPQQGRQQYYVPSAAFALGSVASSYTCPVCTAGPFDSPAALGVHAIMCTGEVPASAAANSTANSPSTTIQPISSPSSQQQQQQSPPLPPPALHLPTAEPCTGTATAAIADDGYEAPLLTKQQLKWKAIRENMAQKRKQAAQEYNGAGAGTTGAGTGLATEQGKMLRLQLNTEASAVGTAGTIDQGEEKGGGGSGGSGSMAVTVAGSGDNVAEPLSVEEQLIYNYQKSRDDSIVDIALVVALLKVLLLSPTHGEHFLAEKGSILVFLPGWDEINQLSKLLQYSGDFNNRSKYRIVQLHSAVPRKEQNEAFRTTSKGEYKIILSTNIAETSITIDDVIAVIDTGRVKEKTYDPHTKLAFLKSTWISNASSLQRRGRAGRTAHGSCFKLYSKLRAQNLDAFQDSELLRMPLEELVLQAKCLGLAPGSTNSTAAGDNASSFLLKAMDPPHTLAIDNALTVCRRINCMDAEEHLTELGLALSKLPLNPRLGRMILYGCLLGCGSSAVSIAACMGHRSPFVMPMNDMQKMQLNRMKSRLCTFYPENAADAGAGDRFSQQNGSNNYGRGKGRGGGGGRGGRGGGSSQQQQRQPQVAPCDHIAVLKAAEGFSAAKRRGGHAEAMRFCDEYFLSFSAMSYIADLCAQLFRTIDEVFSGLSRNRTFIDRHNNDLNLVMAVVGIGLYPDIAVRKRGATNYTTEQGVKTKLHPAGINAKLPLQKNKCENDAEIIGYQELIASGSGSSAGGAASAAGGGANGIHGASMMMLDTCPISIFSLLMFSGELRVVGEVPPSVDHETTVALATEKGEAPPAPPPRMMAVELDAWFHLQLSEQRLLSVQQARVALSIALQSFMRAPTRTKLADGAQAIHTELLAEMMSKEFQSCSTANERMNA